MKLRRLVLLIHGFCHAHLRADSRESHQKSAHFLREEKCIEKWNSALESLTEDEALLMIPWPHAGTGPSADFEAHAEKLLGNRFFLMPSKWKPGVVPDVEFRREMEALLRGPDQNWNREELETCLHTLSCVYEFKKLCKQRDIVFESTLLAEAWGASFEGCVTKYSITFRRMLNLDNPISIPFDMTVPDAEFILNHHAYDEILLNKDIRIHHWVSGDDEVMLLSRTTFQPGTVVKKVEISPGEISFVIWDKSGKELWPGDGEFRLEDIPLRYQEPRQTIIEEISGKLVLPVSAGFAYRLAMRPYFLSGQGLKPMIEKWISEN